MERGHGVGAEPDSWGSCKTKDMHGLPLSHFLWEMYAAAALKSCVGSHKVQHVLSFNGMLEDVERDPCLFLATSPASSVFCHGSASSALHSDLCCGPSTWTTHDKYWRKGCRGWCCAPGGVRDRGACLCMSSLLLLCSGLGGLLELLIC